MRITRIFTDQPLEPNRDVVLNPGASHHLIQVLRLRQGAEMVLFNGDGRDYFAQLETAAKKQAHVKVISCSEPEHEIPVKIHLCISISKGERMDFAIQKSVELGVDEITPLFSQHGVVNLKGERAQKRQQHWRRIVISACEQSGRCRIPLLNDAIEIDKWLDTPHPGTGLVLDPQSRISLASLKQPEKIVTILVGPEGGLSSAEISSAKDLGFTGVSLGPRILRTETAPLAAMAAIQALWGDYR
jgi:16S rRNA (uracil1498-N3)-methyltransferase